MSDTYLLDAKALIALVVADHEHHDRAVRWAAEVDEVAICPTVEGALVRFLVRLGESVTSAIALLAAFHDSPRCVFWPDSISYTTAHLRHIVGHRQVTDAYLAALASSRRCRLATFDRALAGVFPSDTVLIR